MIDIDDFKKINDTYGHIFGDKVLKKTAGAVLSVVRTYNNVIRFGGKEIVIILHRVGEREALDIANRTREKVQSLSLEEHPEVK